MKTYNRKDQLKNLTKDIIDKLIILGERFGFKSWSKWRIPNAELDFVWYIDVKGNTYLFKDTENCCPVAAFEIETSGRTEKHLKGDVTNLLLFPTFLSVIVLLKEGYNPEETIMTYKRNRKTVEQLSKRLSGGRIQVWDKEDINNLLKETRNLAGGS